MKKELLKTIDNVVEKLESKGFLTGADINPLEYEAYCILEKDGWIKPTRGLLPHEEYLFISKTHLFDSKILCGTFSERYYRNLTILHNQQLISWHIE